MTARSDRDLTPEAIVQKVSDASGSKYSTGVSSPTGSGPPPISSKPAFMPTRSSGGPRGFNPLSRPSAPKDTTVDEDGWGQDAPPVTRTQLEKVQPSYQPTKVNMRELSSQKAEPSNFNGGRKDDSIGHSDVIKGAYQPIGKVDIAALRRQAQDTGANKDDRPTIVKGSYEPVGKVNIADIRARAQGPTEGAFPAQSRVSPGAADTYGRKDDIGEERRSLPDRSAPFSSSERLTSLPKPKVANRFGSGKTNFTGTKAPTPGAFGLESKVAPTAPPAGVGRTFADQGGKTPAQLWAEKKAREQGLSGASESQPSVGFRGPASPIASQTSGGGEWKSGYGGKSWAPVQITKTGQSTEGLGPQGMDQDEERPEEAPRSPVGGVGAIRDRFKVAPPMGSTATTSHRSRTSPPPLDISSKPNAGRDNSIPGLPTRPSRPPREEGEEEEEEQEQEQQAQPQQISRMPALPPQPPRSPTPPTPPETGSGSPIRVAMPVGRGQEPEVEDAREEQFSPPPSMPARSLAQAVPHEDDLTEEPSGHDPARGAGAAVAATSFGREAPRSARSAVNEAGKRALVQYDYEKAEDNELELKEGEYVTNIEMVDEDWWIGRNVHGESGLFPSNYVELIEGDEQSEGAATHEPTMEATIPAGPPSDAAGTGLASHGPVATALYDYEAAEDNELSFPENAKITSVVSAISVERVNSANVVQQEFPDEDWWSGEYGGKSGLFPANYVQLDE